MDELCDDLLLLAVRPDGTLTLPANLRFAKLVRRVPTERHDGALCQLRSPLSK